MTVTAMLLAAILAALMGCSTYTVPRLSPVYFCQTAMEEGHLVLLNGQPVLICAPVRPGAGREESVR